MASIFVNIPAYNDPDLAYTIDSAIRAASGANDIHLGICEQVTEYSRAWTVGRGALPPYSRVTARLYKDELLGVGGARASAEGLYDGEDYIFQIDSHSRFQPHWDESLIRSVAQLPTPGILTGLMPKDPWGGRNQVPITKCEAMDKEGFPRYRAEMTYSPERSWYPARHVHAGSLFGPAWVDSVRYDPHIMFIGEEPTFAPRLWTAGFDLYHMALPVMHGYISFPNRPWTKKEWHFKDAVSLRRCRALLGIEECAQDDPALVELDKYGFGSARPFTEWQEWSGFNYNEGSVVASWGEWQTPEIAE